MAERFANKAIIVTGAGNGMGRASAMAFAREGGGVAVAEINAADGQASDIIVPSLSWSRPITTSRHPFMPRITVNPSIIKSKT